jgi:hypothetical protein
MAKDTKGKRTTSKPALKRKTAAARKPLRAKERSAFPGGAKVTADEMRRVAPRMTRG